MDTDLPTLQVGCEVCVSLHFPQKKDYVIAQSEHWRITLAPDQYYLGRCYVTSLRHVRELSRLSADEWMELQSVIRELESAMERQLQATHVTWAFLMNNAYQLENPQPHVHAHVRPRYREQVTVGDVTALDTEFGYHHQRELHRTLLPEQMADITARLQACMPSVWLPTV